MRNTSTSTGTRPRVTIDNDTGMIAPNPALAGFWDGVVDFGKSFGKDLVSSGMDYGKQVGQAKVEQKKAETQLKLEQAKADAEAKRILAQAQADALSRGGITANVPGMGYKVEWYRDPNVMLPMAIGLGALLFYMKKKGK